MKSNIIPTIIITEELHSNIRGYSLVGREFVLKEPIPRRDHGITIDGSKYLDDYWVISKDEYMRVVPEAQKTDLNSDEIYIPVYVARLSFRPAYIKTTTVKL